MKIFEYMKTYFYHIFVRYVCHLVKQVKITSKKLPYGLNSFIDFINYIDLISLIYQFC